MHCPNCAFLNQEPQKVCAKCGSPLTTAERFNAVRKAQESWIGNLIDLSRRNRLLYFTDLKTGTLDLSDCDLTLLSDLLKGESVALLNLLRHVDERSSQDGPTKFAERRPKTEKSAVWKH